MTSNERGRKSPSNFVRLNLPPFAVREIQSADCGNPHEHQDSGEQDDDNQGSLLVLVNWKQLNRQGLTALLISDLWFVSSAGSDGTRTLADTNFLHPLYWYWPNHVPISSLTGRTPRNLTLGQANRPVPGVNRQRLAPAIHLAAHL